MKLLTKIKKSEPQEKLWLVYAIVHHIIRYHIHFVAEEPVSEEPVRLSSRFMCGGVAVIIENKIFFQIQRIRDY